MADRILIADDDREIVRTVRAYLEDSGFEVSAAHDGSSALTAFHNERPDLIVLDVMMPELDGLDVVRTIRRQSDVPIIMLTARVEEMDRLIGLELGADDYVTKPFSPRELVARVKGVLRRTKGPAVQQDLIRIGGIQLDDQAHSVTLHGAPVDLTPTEFSLLKVFMENVGRVMTRLQLIDTALGYSYDGYDRTVDAHIKNLRQKIETDPGNPEFIVTVYGVGYKFVEPSDAL
ncbi:MAG: response regulator transcription factor [Chloroflexi bacterium]|nr:response regulator transcription factor [Chloroflexota bacterium]